ncbi:density-regulated protein homolog [Paramacrobiotus metropolitanus]|uniref:density-regulated protein homolog n=1 Tax=Paramacrobiotus metropolitanus TaxID=2943436 RepID=UPI0024460B01|nr:density-regulated protein homolog [Paramacrobiotus metropolitanus]
MSGDTAVQEFPNPVLPNPETKYPIVVDYCGVCSLPVEYCDYSPEPEKCKEWLKQNLPGQFKQLNVGAAEEPATTSTADEDGDGKEEEAKKRQTRGGKARIKLPAAEEKKKPGLIKLSIASRGKKKYVTLITGLGTHGIDLKLAAKFFGQKFACGSSVTGEDEIVIQGDVKDDLLDLIPEKWSEIDEDLIEDLGEQKR